MYVPTSSLVVLCGAPAAGKSTFAAAHFPPDEIVSRDVLALCGPLGGRHFWDAIEGRLARGARVVIDCTCLSPRTRVALRTLARRYGRSAHLVILATPPRVTRARDACRETPHDEAMMRRCHEKLVAALQDAPREGWDAIDVIKGF